MNSTRGRFAWNQYIIRSMTLPVLMKHYNPTIVRWDGLNDSNAK